MNIFAVSTDPATCARALDNRRLVKMVLETGQLLSVGRAAHGLSSPYKPTHANHPVAIWVRANRANLNWTFALLKALAAEFEFRFGKEHKTWLAFRHFGPDHVPEAGARRTPFQNSARNLAIGLDFSDIKPTTKAYRAYLKAKWDAEAPSWGPRRPPRWA
jgi:Pyrimidine dimer DNA glycosylase